MQDSISQQQQAAQVRQTAREQAELEANTLCAMNADSGKCICRDKRDGKRIDLNYEECVAEASN